ncbi:MAG: LysR family transcriptional regulator [Propylenella sp.]
MEDFSLRDLTLRQLQILWTVAHAGSLTRAAKQLEMRQPSISQQISKMESALGGKLVRFVNNEMRLTPAGEYLVEEAGRILGLVDEAKAGLTEFFSGERGRIVIGALPSLARNILMPTFAALLEAKAGYVIDIVEMTPREAIEQLHGRMIDMALISGYAAATRLSAGLRHVVLMEDAQYLAVPPGIADLTDVKEPEKELSPRDWSVLNRTIRYAFASEHSDRVNMWYEQLLPENRVLARCRSFESALAFVEMGLGTAIVPELAVHQNGRPLFNVVLYSVPLPPRKTLLVAPDHYFNLPHVKAFVAAYNKCSTQLGRPKARPAPQFAARRLVSDAPDIATLATNLP